MKQTADVDQVVISGDILDGDSQRLKNQILLLLEEKLKLLDFSQLQNICLILTGDFLMIKERKESDFYS